MDDLTKRCAEAIGWKHLGAIGIEPPERGQPEPKGVYCLSGGNDWWLNPEGHHVCGPCQMNFDPLHNDEQAMALVKKLGLNFTAPTTDDKQWYVWTYREGEIVENADLNRAIVECVAAIDRTAKPE